MKSTLEIILSPYCAGILNEENYQYIVVKKRDTKEDAVLQIAATSEDGLTKQRDHLKTHLAQDKEIAPKDKKDLEIILGLIEYEIARRS